jgi:hypothetical protein
MLALRILVICSVALLIISLLGYSFTRNPGWLGFALNTLKISIALGVLLLIAQMSMRYIV